MLEQLEARAAAAGLESDRRTLDGGTPALWITFGDEAGAHKRLVSSPARAEGMLGIPFEDYRAVPGYAAIYSQSSQEVEARLRTIGPFYGLSRRIPFDQPYTMVAPDGRELELAKATSAYRLIAPGPRMLARALQNAIVLKVRGFGIDSPDAARQVLDELGPSLMFEMDIVYDQPAELVRSEARPSRSSLGWKRSSSPPEFPANSYDQEPVALYMYGRSARGMPLLEYLAYYQSIEFYFPRYAAAEVRRRVERIVKDPRFNPYLDRDVGRLVEIIQAKGGRTHGSELEQLKVTFRSCVEEEEVREFLQANDDVREFFRDRRSPLTSRTLSLADRNTDLRDAAAARIYDLRCRIVHTKDDPAEGDPERLLPNSPEAQLLDHDLALLRLLAVRVLVASSRELTN